jgi:MATE family multidrug resistance protein
MVAMTMVIALASSSIPLLFLGSGAVDAAATIALASTLLVVGMSFFIADGTQTVAAGALRGLNDTRMPLVFATISFWLIAFPAGLWLAFQAGWGAIGVWIGLSLGVLVYAILLVARFHILTSRHYLPELVEPA